MSKIVSYIDFPKEAIKTEVERISSEKKGHLASEVVSLETLVFLDYYMSTVEKVVSRSFLTEKLKDSVLAEEILTCVGYYDFFDNVLSKYYFIRIGKIDSKQVYFCFEKTLDNE